MVFHYDSSGLDNVYLTSGFEIEQHEHYGELVSLAAVNGLHKRLGEVLVFQAPFLTGAAMRLIRADVFGHWPADLALALGLTEAEVLAFESDRSAQLPPAVDRELRRYAMEHVGVHDIEGPLDLIDHAATPYCILLGMEGDEWVGSITYEAPTHLTD
jgi:hypothetical protein